MSHKYRESCCKGLNWTYSKNCQERECFVCGCTEKKIGNRWAKAPLTNLKEQQKNNIENEEVARALRYALEWIGRKPKGKNERHTFILAEGAIRNAMVRVESKSKP